jgi:hypothetical protein
MRFREALTMLSADCALSKNAQKNIQKTKIIFLIILSPWIRNTMVHYDTLIFKNLA